MVQFVTVLAPSLPIVSAKPFLVISASFILQFSTSLLIFISRVKPFPPIFAFVMVQFITELVPSIPIVSTKPFCPISTSSRVQSETLLAFPMDCENPLLVIFVC